MLGEHMLFQQNLHIWDFVSHNHIFLDKSFTTVLQSDIIRKYLFKFYFIFNLDKIYFKIYHLKCVKTGSIECITHIYSFLIWRHE